MTEEINTAQEAIDAVGRVTGYLISMAVNADPRSRQLSGYREAPPLGTIIQELQDAHDVLIGSRIVDEEPA